MIGTATAVSLVATKGLAILVPLAIIEGPVITIIAGWMAMLGLIDPVAAYVALVLADLVGDGVLYMIGRRGLARLPLRWRNWLGLTDERMARVDAHFRDHGPRTLVLGKLTHTAGAAVLVAAGSARMPVMPFLLWNLLATLPKTAFFLAIGWIFGATDQRVGHGLFWLAVLALGVFALVLYRMRRQSGYPAE
jgi:membrane protein DedA with SNARE-associated domain